MIANKHTTLFDGGVANQITTPLQVVADDDTQEVQLLNLYPDIRYQTIDGFGGAITFSPIESQILAEVCG